MTMEVAKYVCIAWIGYLVTAFVIGFMVGHIQKKYKDGGLD